MNSWPKWILLITALVSCRSSTVAPLGTFTPNNDNVILAHAQAVIVHEAPPHVFSPRSHLPRVRSDPPAPNLAALPKMVLRLNECHGGTPTVAHGGGGTIAANVRPPPSTPTPTYKLVPYKGGSGTTLPPPPAKLETRGGLGMSGAPVTA